MNSCMVVCLCIRKKSSTSGKFISNPKDTEAKLFLFSLLTGLSFSMSFVLKVIFFLNPNMSDEMYVVINNVQAYAWDLFMLTPPWFILFLSSLIRNEFKKVLGFTKHQTIVVTPMTVS
uniref:Serpentine receptor class gamma n=1 Tax=Acrobeloides nanus TaxID=290746 RepID=A0A914DKF8_9BILA